jgi:hypothetical protein
LIGKLFEAPLLAAQPFETEVFDSLGRAQASGGLASFCLKLGEGLI